MTENAADVTLHSEMQPIDWDDIANSEFVDYVSSPVAESDKIGFVFEHEEIGLHGFQFIPSVGLLKPCAFDPMGDD